MRLPVVRAHETHLAWHGAGCRSSDLCLHGIRVHADYQLAEVHRPYFLASVNLGEAPEQLTRLGNDAAGLNVLD